MVTHPFSSPSSPLRSQSKATAWLQHWRPASCLVASGVGASEPGQSPKQCLFCNMLHFSLRKGTQDLPREGEYPVHLHCSNPGFY